MSLAERIALVNEKIAAAARQAGREPSEVTLVAATKVQTSDTIRQAIAAGVTICGENRVQEMTAHLDDDAYAGAAAPLHRPPSDQQGAAGSGPGGAH